jgi:CDP-diacylglycerol--serine O-phosphatidyltransferase
MRQHIPNFITQLNVFSGCVATVFAVLNQLEFAAIFVFLGIFFDFFDGLAARLLNVRSELGVQLDSLADMITSGLVPGIVMFQLINDAIELNIKSSWEGSIYSFPNGPFDTGTNEIYLLGFFGFIITLASAYRLAKFNIDDNQTSSFIGLPTPANALLILSLPLILLYQNNDVLNEIILNQWFLIGLTILSAFLLNSKIELFSFKFNNYGFRENGVKYLFLIGSLVLLLTLKFMAIPLIIALYIFASLAEKQFQKP